MMRSKYDVFSRINSKQFLRTWCDPKPTAGRFRRDTLPPEGQNLLKFPIQNTKIKRQIYNHHKYYFCIFCISTNTINVQFLLVFAKNIIFKYSFLIPLAVSSSYITYCIYDSKCNLRLFKFSFFIDRRPNGIIYHFTTYAHANIHIHILPTKSKAELRFVSFDKLQCF